MPTPTLFVTGFSADWLALKGNSILSSQPAAAHTVYSIDPRGARTALAAVPLLSTTGHNWIAVAPPESAAAGFTPGDIFVAPSELRFGTPDHIYKIHGTTVTSFVASSGCGGITFDRVGTYGYNLIAVGFDNTLDGTAVTIDSGGTITGIGSFGNNCFSPVVVPDGFGAYGGELLAADSDGWVRTLSTPWPGDGVFGWADCSGLCFVPGSGDNGNFYVAGASSGGCIYQYNANDLAALAGKLIVYGQTAGGIGWWDGDSGSGAVDLGNTDVLKGSCFGFLNCYLDVTLGPLRLSAIANRPVDSSVDSCLSIEVMTLPLAYVGLAYNFVATGSDIFTVSLLSGLLPDQLTLDQPLGNQLRIAGVPAGVGTFSFMVRSLRGSDVHDTLMQLDVVRPPETGGYIYGN